MSASPFAFTASLTSFALRSMSCDALAVPAAAAAASTQANRKTSRIPDPDRPGPACDRSLGWVDPSDLPDPSARERDEVSGRELELQAAPPGADEDGLPVERRLVDRRRQPPPLSERADPAD